jgi:hypothetical protein
MFWRSQRISEARNQHDAGSKQSLHIPPKCWLTFNGLQGITSQKVEFFITTAVRTSNPATYLKDETPRHFSVAASNVISTKYVKQFMGYMEMSTYKLN